MSERGGGDPNTPMTVIVGLMSALLLFVVVVLLQAFFYHSEREENRRKVVAVTPQELAQVRAQQQEVLHSYRWIDQQKKVVAIPIDRAISLLVERGGGVPVAPTPQPPSRATRR
ncbi:MAG: hypothetical protein ACM3O7_02765 [Acidobacteriota bacterium]